MGTVSTLIERDVETGWSAWYRGELDLAREKLARGVEGHAGPAAAFPYARVLHELGDSERGLEILERILDAGVCPVGARVHRAWIHYDRGDDAAVERGLAELSPSNFAVQALRALVDARKGAWDRVRFPRAALWTADILGRLIALLEEEFARRHTAELDRFHHSLLCPSAEDGDTSEDTAAEDTASEDTAPDNPAVPSKAAAKRSGVSEPWKRAEWEDALELAFATRRFQRFLALWHESGIPADWTKSLSREYWVYSHYSITPVREALGHATALVDTDPGNVEYRWVRALLFIRAGATRDAALEFVRIARKSDTQAHAVMIELARELGIEIGMLED
jgi:hypothetical protein